MNEKNYDENDFAMQHPGWASEAQRKSRANAAIAANKAAKGRRIKKESNNNPTLNLEFGKIDLDDATNGQIERASRLVLARRFSNPKPSYEDCLAEVMCEDESAQRSKAQ
jgi:hypothetical protein